jgi:hypothetical protein
MKARSYVPRAATALATAGALGACLTGEIVDLGRNLEGGVPSLANTGLDATLLSEGGAPIFSAAISATMGTICEGACVELLATASGLPGPYAYQWGQGLGTGAGPKPVCPVATTTYSVTVSPTTSEQQSTASAMIVVVACDSGTSPAPPPPHDAGGPAPPPSDSGGPPTAALCVSNPSFEGTPTIGTNIPPGIPPTAAPPQWQVCLGDPDIDPSLSLLPASDQKTYVGLAVGTGTFSNMAESLGTTLCAPLQAGTHYSFCIDLAIGIQGVTSVAPPPGSPTPTLQIWGGKSACSQDELLWTSQPITNRDAWMRVCGTFVPSQTLSNISLLAALGASVTGPGTLSYVIADHIVPGP